MFAVNRRLENIALDTGKQCAAVFRIARIIAEVGKRYPVALADIDTARTGTRRSEIDIRVGVAVKEFGVVVASRIFAAVAKERAGDLCCIARKL